MSYTIDTRNLAEIRKEIKDAILQKLQDARGNALSAVVSVVYGDQMEVGTIEEMPVVWILPVSHQPELKGGHTAIHDFIFDFVVMVHDLESTSGKELAEELTARVYDVIVSDRTLEKKVFDVRALNFDPSMKQSLIPMCIGQVVNLLFGFNEGNKNIIKNRNVYFH
jgi:phage gp37-like protein